jgi:hypothetical protein
MWMQIDGTHRCTIGDRDRSDVIIDDRLQPGP